MINVYFISGMCVNCRVFDRIQLPAGYQKNYIEWYVPSMNESLEEYTRNMAKGIDTSKPFILIGYSLGAIVMQEMNRFLHPEQNIVLSSMKSEEEIPALFRLAKKSHLISILPKALFKTNKTITNLFSRIVYDMTPEEIERYITYTQPAYMKWATLQITNWKPTIQCENLYHIHGRKDQIFPCQKIKNVEILEGADHLMVLRRTEEINKTLANLLSLPIPEHN